MTNEDTWNIFIATAPMYSVPPIIFYHLPPLQALPYSLKLMLETLVLKFLAIFSNLYLYQSIPS
jgi:hypothetical protein